MPRIVVFAILMVWCPFALAQALTLAEVKAKGAVQLSAADLKQLLPGDTVISQTPTGSTRRWQNRADGDLSGSSDGRGTQRALPYSGSGTWKIDDNGTYCVHIRWNMLNEDWCRYVFRAGDKYYTFGTLEDTARAWEFEFSK